MEGGILNLDEGSAIHADLLKERVKDCISTTLPRFISIEILNVTSNF